MTHRRTFLALLGATAAASAMSTGAAETSETAVGSAGDATALEPAEALVAYVDATYGERLDDDDLEVIREGIEGSLAAGAAFREVGLENADAPAYGFSAYRGDLP
jgi:Flp pilus assembly protein CpaB